MPSESEIQALSESEIQALHERADHEDNLLISRTSLFISFNGFLALAVTIVDDLKVKLGFAVLVVMIDLAWSMWAPDSRKFIRALRDAGGARIDEKIWVSVVGGGEKWRGVLNIVTVYIPWLLAVGWGVLVAYFVCSGST